MRQEEIDEVYRLLSDSKLNPQLCDKSVCHYENGVHAGIPTEPGDYIPGNRYMIPHQMAHMHPVYVVDVIGDSMRDAGILPGDHLQVEAFAPVHDGDIVIASIDGECTVKAFCTDERGQRWLVPRNDNYDAIPLTEDMNVCFVGRVVGHIRDTPRSPYSDLMRTIRRTRSKGGGERPVNQNRVETAIRSIAPSVEHGRQWYAVYRAMVDRRVHEEGDYGGFVALVTRLVPDHGHLPVAKELSRMAVQSFRKPVALWECGNAPVSGQRYYDYLRIARLMANALG